MTDQYSGIDVWEQLLAHAATPEGAVALRESGLSPDDIPNDLAAAALEVILEYMADHGQPPSEDVLADEIGLEDDFPEPIDIAEHWIGKARQKLLAAEAVHMLRRAAKVGQGDPEEALRIVVTEAPRLLATASRSEAESNVVGVEGVADWYIGQKELSQTGISWGFEEMDEALGGLRNEFCVLAGRKKRFKSWLLAKSAVSTCLRGLPITFATLEMPTKETQMRFTAMVDGLKWDLVSKTLESGDRVREAEEAMSQLEAPPHFVRFSTGRKNVASLVDAAVANGSKVLYVDQLSFMDRARTDAKWQEVGDIAQQFKDAAAEIPILCAVQENRIANAATKFMDADGTEVADSDEIVRAADMLLRVFASSQMQANHILHYGVRESRRLEPRAWEVSVQLNRNSNFDILGGVDLEEEKGQDD